MEGESHPAITWNHAFGVQSASGAVTYLGDKSKEQPYILYPVGRHLGICTPMDSKATAGSMSFVPLEREITAIEVSHNAKHVAVVEGISRDAKHRCFLVDRQHDFRAVRQFSNDFVKHVGRNRGGTRLFDHRWDLLEHFQVQIGGLELQFVSFCPDQRIGQDRDGIAPLHDAMYAIERIEQVRSFNCDTHLSALLILDDHLQ